MSPTKPDRFCRNRHDDGTGSAATLPASISNHGQSTLPDGRVIVSGGSGSAKCYIYTPSANAWVEAASMPTSISWLGQSTLNDGKVLVSGGSGRNTTYIYTPSSTGIGIWEVAASLPININTHGQSTLPDDRVLISSGHTGSLYPNMAYIYTPNGTWTSVASMLASFDRHGQSTLLDSKVLVVGGWNNGTSFFNTSYVYIPNAGIGTWEVKATLPTSIWGHGQSTLADGKVLVSGGAPGSSTTYLNTAYIYVPSNNTWTSVASLPTIGRYGLRQSTLADGRVLISGGQDNNGTLNTAYIYTPAGWVAVGNKNNVCKFFLNIV